MLKRAKLTDTDGTEMVCREMVPEWIQRMRDAAQKHLTPDVVDRIILNQIKRAEGGDAKAIQFVMDYLMGGKALKGATFIQNNNYGNGDANPAKPTKLLPGSAAKVELLRRRIAAGMNTDQPGDVGAAGEGENLS